MQLKAEQLSQHLQGELRSCYLIHGDEPLLVQESRDQLSAAFKQHGLDERIIWHLDASFQWDQLTQLSQSLSLFSQRRIFDLRLPGKLNAQGQAALADYCAQPADDSLLMISANKLDKPQLNGKGLKALAQEGVVIPIWPLSREQFPRWLQQRLQRQQLNISRDALQLLNERLEGNLLAAAQEVERLALLNPGPSIELDWLESALADQAKYSLFQLPEAILSGQLARSAKILQTLQLEGEPALKIITVICQDLRKLIELQQLAPMPLAQRFNQLNIWPKRRPLYQQALSRLSLVDCESALSDALHLDGLAKGANSGNLWLALQQWIYPLAGQPQPLPPSYR